MLPKKIKILLVIGIIISITLSAVYVATIGSHQENDSNSKLFSIAVINDEQFLSQNFHDLLYQTYAWVADNKERYNIKLLIGSGDHVDDNYNITQWQTVKHAINPIIASEIPFGWCAGNHDQFNAAGVASENGAVGSPNGKWLGDDYCFDLATFRSKSYYESECMEGKNTAVQFQEENYKFLVINLEFKANQTVFDNWLLPLLNDESFQDFNIIVNTHTYLNSTGGYMCNNDDGIWENKLRALMDSDNRIFMVHSGHTGAGGIWGFTQEINDRQEIFFNRQGNNATKGAASIRLYTFNLETGMVTAQTYDVLRNAFISLDNSPKFTANQAAFDFKAHIRPCG